MTPLKQQISLIPFSIKKVIILLQQSTFRRFAAKYYHLFYWKWYQLIFAVLEVSFWALTTVVKLPWKFLTLSNVSAVSDSDVGHQYMLITLMANFQYVVGLLFPTSEWQPINVFLCLPLALLPSIIPVNAIASNWLFLMICPTNRICLLTITFRRFLDVLALWSTSSLDTLSIHAICNIRRKTTFL